MQRYRIGVSYLLLLTVSLFFVREAAGSWENDHLRNARWTSPKIAISVSNSLSQENANIKGDTGDAIRNSIFAWSRSADIAIAVSSTELQNVSPRGARGDGVSLITSASTAENLKLFPNQAESPAAATRVFVTQKGSISEADIVLNPFVQFSTDGTFGTYDLQDTLTHEIGHLLGLEHSDVWGSIMYERGSKNSEFYSEPRSELPKVDAAAIKNIYGARPEEMECCGSVSGRISGLQGKRNHKTLVWLEESDTGRVAAAAVVTADGTYRIGGVSEGRYRILFSSESGANLAANDSSEVSVATADETRIDLSARFKETPFRVRFLGSSPQLAQLPIRIAPDMPVRIYLGGAGILRAKANIRFSTEHVLAGAELSEELDFGDAVNVMGFELSVTGKLPRGEYTLITEDQNGNRRFIVGALHSAGN